MTDQHIPDLGAGGGREVERLIFFSDAVMAIAMTLLVIDLKLPESLGAMTSDADLRAALDGLGPRFLSVLLSFAVIAIWWNGHNRIFRNLERADGALVVLNLVFLGAIAAVARRRRRSIPDSTSTKPRRSACQRIARRAEPATRFVAAYRTTADGRST